MARPADAGVVLSSSLTFALRRSGKLGPSNSAEFTQDDVGYLDSLGTAGVDGVDKLIDMIAKYDRVEVWLA